MSDPYTQIMDKVEERLNLVTVSNGYHRTVEKVERARLTPFTDGDIPSVNFWSGTDILIDAGGGFEKREFTVYVDARDMTRDRPFTDIASELATDLRTALSRDVLAPSVTDNPSSSLGGLVTKLVVSSVTPAIGEGQAPWCGVLLVLIIEYKIHNSDPLTLVN